MVRAKIHGRCLNLLQPLHKTIQIRLGKEIDHISIQNYTVRLQIIYFLHNSLPGIRRVNSLFVAKKSVTAIHFLFFFLCIISIFHNNMLVIYHSNGVFLLKSRNLDLFFVKNGFSTYGSGTQNHSKKHSCNQSSLSHKPSPPFSPPRYFLCKLPRQLKFPDSYSARCFYERGSQLRFHLYKRPA